MFPTDNTIKAMTQRLLAIQGTTNVTLNYQTRDDKDLETYHGIMSFTFGTAWITIVPPPHLSVKISAMTRLDKGSRAARISDPPPVR
ncbi:hypothetical protein F2Q70_00028972 [Brassica cretica]|uniref:Uncharacterized protein n=1 Tax=Brassica cretica TaxID=69181 RepID=A0A8S9FHL2_BRACR|nr:hypothetical protein F2Q70_00028972 [Brassica cretica]KAF2581553.1 hypothetical protein F2Q68_00004648 [Brassica cretica]